MSDVTGSQPELLPRESESPPLKYIVFAALGIVGTIVITWLVCIYTVTDDTARTAKTYIELVCIDVATVMVAVTGIYKLAGQLMICHRNEQRQMMEQYLRLQANHARPTR